MTGKMGYPLDKEKWRRVREMMERNDLDAIVARAPDNVLYLTNYWTMKGYDLAIFPREGEPTLLVIEPQFREAQRTAWNKDVRCFPFYHPKDPRPPMIRAVEMAVEVLKERNLTRRVGIELSQNSQICEVCESSMPTRRVRFRSFKTSTAISTARIIGGRGSLG